MCRFCWTLKPGRRGGVRSLACLINEFKFDDGQDDDNDTQEDEGVLCCQGAQVLFQEKLTNWLQGALASSVFQGYACMCVCLSVSMNIYSFILAGRDEYGWNTIGSIGRQETHG